MSRVATEDKDARDCLNRTVLSFSKHTYSFSFSPVSAVWEIFFNGILFKINVDAFGAICGVK